jgi:hypothetical protein
MKMKILLTAVCAISAILTTKADVVLSNFEDNTINGWQSWDSNPISTVAAPTASFGGYSMLETVNGQYWGKETLPSWANGLLTSANLNAGTQISFDLYFPSANWGATHADVKLEIQNGFGSTTLQTITASSTLNSITKDVVTHVTFDLSSFNVPLDPATTWVNMSLFV